MKVPGDSQPYFFNLILLLQPVDSKEIKEDGSDSNNGNKEPRAFVKRDGDPERKGGRLFTPCTLCIGGKDPESIGSGRE
jgi:hypothetical protein